MVREHATTLQSCGSAATPRRRRNSRESGEPMTYCALVGPTGSAAAGLSRVVRQAPPSCLACRRYYR